jgi:hypothetical protein
VQEELALHPSQLQLVTAGRPQPVDDGGRRFLVHPFLFRARPGVQLQPQLNWENTEWAWVTPG